MPTHMYAVHTTEGTHIFANRKDAFHAAVNWNAPYATYSAPDYVVSPLIGTHTNLNADSFAEMIEARGGYVENTWDDHLA